MEEKVLSASANETKQIAKNFARKLKKKEVICFYGNLGSGKTTFIQGLAGGLGIKVRIISPTFIIVRQYKIPPANNERENTFYHADLYRIENSKQAESLGLKEIFDQDEGVIVIEWAERITDILPKKRWEISLENLGGNEREIRITKFSNN